LNPNNLLPGCHKQPSSHHKKPSGHQESAARLLSRGIRHGGTLPGAAQPSFGTWH
jgi:hypothetical protein